MEKCQHCGKDLSSQQVKYCSRSCSASANNRKRVRRPWAKKQRETGRVGKNICIVQERKCKYCNSRLVEESAKNTVCEDCKKINRVTVFFSRLGISEGKYEERRKKAVEKLQYEYHQVGMSLPEIRDKYNLNLNSLKRFFTGNGIKTRDHSKGAYSYLLRGRGKLISPGIQGVARYKQGWHTTWEGKKVFLRSSYELDYAKELDKKRIKYTVEEFRIEYLDTVKKVKRVAIPDFYLPDYNELVEIKSTYTFNKQNMVDRFKAYRKLGYKCKMLLEHKEVEVL